ncbi:MAG: polyprenyl synthetase family protein [Butyricicoccus sp.]
MTFEQRLKEYAAETEAFLDRYLNTAGCVGQEEIVDAMRYSALAGGKRLRPALTLEFCRAACGGWKQALPFAAALEMIHTYSLIHDDLPCMDNDDLRRGKPTSHKVYGEAMAVLAGDALLTQAFELATNSGYTEGLAPAVILRAVNDLSREAGVLGMIGGQVLDLDAEHKSLDYDALIRLQERKTGALMRTAAHMGCILGGATEAQYTAADHYAAAVGLAFQIQDDILDIIGDEQELGKPIGSDSENDKSTFPKLLGLPACQEKVHALTEEAIEEIRSAFDDSDFLVSLAASLVDRRK